MSKRSVNWIVFGITSILLFAIAANAYGAMSSNEIQAAIEKKYDAKVLKVFVGTELGRPVYFVKVMFKGGNYNTAFQVNTLVVDAKTGKRLPQFRHRASGRELSGTIDNRPNKQSPSALRGHVWR
jgi:hypothetical protein